MKELILVLILSIMLAGCNLLFNPCYHPLATGGLKYCECSDVCESEENCNQCVKEKNKQ